jgi:hypothetical protein
MQQLEPACADTMQNSKESSRTYCPFARPYHGRSVQHPFVRATSHVYRNWLVPEHAQLQTGATYGETQAKLHAV